MNKFLAKNPAHSFLKDHLKEMYLLDPRMNSEELVNRMLAWANGSPDEKRIRVYVSTPDAAYLRIINTARFPRVPFIQSTPDGLRTLTVTNNATWAKSAKDHGASRDIVNAVAQFGPMHELHAATLIVHALRRSAFEAAPVQPATDRKSVV